MTEEDTNSIDKIKPLIIDAINKTYFALVLCSNTKAILKITQKTSIEEYLEGVFDDLNKCLELIQKV